MIAPVVESMSDPFADLVKLLRDILDEVARLSQDYLPGIVETAEDTIINTAELSATRYGHYCSDSWTDGEVVRPEIVVNADFLDRGPEHVVLVIVHELAHAFNKVRGVRDTCRDGRYHNRNFGEVAATLGLGVLRDRSMGVTTAGLSPTGEIRYAALLLEVKERLHLARQGRARTTRDGDEDGDELVGGGATGEAPISKPKYVFPVCECTSSTGHPVTIRVPRGAWRPGVIVCTGCGTPFQVPDGNRVGVSSNATSRGRA